MKSVESRGERETIEEHEIVASNVTLLPACLPACLPVSDGYLGLITIDLAESREQPKARRKEPSESDGGKASEMCGLALVVLAVVRASPAHGMEQQLVVWCAASLS